VPLDAKPAPRAHAHVMHIGERRGRRGKLTLQGNSSTIIQRVKADRSSVESQSSAYQPLKLEHGDSIHERGSFWRSTNDLALTLQSASASSDLSLERRMF
jgi:hypothetical protein